MNTLIRLGAMAGILAGALLPLAPARVAAQDGGAPAPEGGDGNGGAKDGGAKDGGAAPVAKRKPPKDPSRGVAARIDEALLGIVEGSAAGRISSRANLKSAIEEWAADAKDDPLRAVKWWKEALLRTLPTSNHKTGVQEIKIPYGQGREARLWLSVPRSYTTKSIYPLLITVLDRDDDPRRTLTSTYGDVIKDWVVVAVPPDPKDAGFDILKDPWMAGLGMRYAIENLRIDRDRVAIDGLGVGAGVAFALGSEWAVQFCGCVLRNPATVPPLSANLGLLQPILVPPEGGAVPPKVLEAARAAAPEGVEAAAPVIIEGGKGMAERVEKAILALPPRRISRTEVEPFAWAAQPQGGEVWAYWVWVFRPATAKKERLVQVRLRREPAANALEITGDNLGELILLLNDDLVDLDHDVLVRVNGVQVWKGKAERKIDTALYWLGQTGDRALFVPAEIRFTVPDEASSPRKEGDAPASPDGGKAPPPPEDGGSAAAGTSPPKAPTDDEAKEDGAPPAPPPSEEPPDPGTGEKK